MISVYVAAISKGGKVVGPVKVGMSVNPADRIKSSQTFCPYELVLVHEFPLPDRDLARYTERMFHKLEAKHRIRGEWFDMEPIVAVQKIALDIEISLHTFCDLDSDDLAAAREAFGLSKVMNLAEVT